MVRLRNKVHSKGKRAFTLVELIVVLVILAILAAMLVPALTGYIKRAKRTKSLQKADEARIAAQAAIAQFYGLYDGEISQILDGSNKTAANVDWWSDRGAMEYGDMVLDLMGYGRGAENGEPYILVVGVGHDEAPNLTDAQKTTVYYVGYIEELGSPALFYVNGQWIYRWPRDTGDVLRLSNTGYNRNVLHTPQGNIPLRFYIICNRNQTDQIWLDGEWRADRNTLQGNSERSDGTYRRGISF